MNNFEELRIKVLGAFPRVLEATGNDLTETASRLVEGSRARLAAGRFYVVCCGEFRRGKSSLLNALVERDRLFPVDVSLTTCAVTTLEWGEQDQATAYLGERGKPGDAVKQVPLDLAEVEAYVAEQSNPANSKDVRLVAMRAPIPQLESGLVLTDTPGIGSHNIEHTAATYAFIPHADAILFVCSGVEPVTTHEISFLTDVLGKCKILVTAATMIDKVVDSGPVIARSRTRIAEAVGCPPDDLVIVPVSALRKAQAFEDGDKELLAKSGFPELEAQIWGGLAATCGAAQLMTALDALESAVASAEAPLANEFAALQNDDALRNTECELKDLLDESSKLKKSGAKWRVDFSDSLKKAARPIGDKLNEDLLAARTELNGVLGTEQGRSDPESAVTTAASQMVDAANAAEGELQRKFGALLSEFKRKTSLPLSVEFPDSSPFGPVINIPAANTDARVGGFRRFRAGWGGGMALGGAGGTVGAVIGTFIAPGPGTVVGFALGALVGNVAGWFAGSRDDIKRAREQDQRNLSAALRQSLLPQVDHNRTQAAQRFKYAVEDLVTDLTRNLSEQVDARHESLQESVRRVSKLKDARQEELVQQRKQLLDRQQVYAGLHGELADLQRGVIDLNHPRADTASA
jgi:predicted lipid-binding transport protein (Tim44 family)